jgi:arsenate reductase
VKRGWTDTDAQLLLRVMSSPSRIPVPRSLFAPRSSSLRCLRGRVAERLNAAVSKTVSGVKPPTGVRIPPLPYPVAILIEAVPTLTVYEKPTCSTCRKLRALLGERGVEFESIDYHVRGIEEGELRELLRKLGLGPREILRTREPLVKELGLDRPEASDDELIAQMVSHPALVQRPIVVCGDRALLARPVERALELL